MSLKSKYEHIRADIHSARKSNDTEEWFDRVFTNPLGYFAARFFIHIGWTPNMVTLLSLITGVAGGLMLSPEKVWINVLGMILIVVSNIFDSSDGQIARLTGSSSMLGSLFDSFSAICCSVSVYIALGIKLFSHNIPFTHTPWGGLIWVVIVIVGLLGRRPQYLMSDYYRSLHLYFLGSRDESEHYSSSDILKQRSALPKDAIFRRIYLRVLALSLRVQEAATPDTQKLLKALEEAGTTDEIRSEWLEKSRKHLFLTNVLTFNVRTYGLFLCILVGVPALGLALELFGLGTLLLMMISRYERLSRDMLYSHKLPGSEIPYKKPNLWPAIFFCLGIIGVISTLASTDLSAVDWKGSVLDKFGVWFPSILGIWLLIYLMHTAVYAVIIGKDWRKIKPLRLFRMVISGFALNNVTPVGFAGGEPYRIMELKGSIGTEKATASAFTFTIMNTMSNLAFWFFGALMYLLTGCKGGVLAAILAIVILGVMGFACWMFIRSKGDRFVTGALEKLSKIPLVGKHLRKLLENNREMLERIDSEMGEFRTRTRDFVIVFAAEFLTRLLEAAEIFVLLRVLGADIGYFFTVASLASASIFGNLIFFIPMQMGSREAAFALTLGWANVVPSVAVTSSLLSRIREIIYLAIGVGMMLMKSEDKTE